MASVRYWAAARELAGRSVEDLPGATLPEVLAAVGRAYGPRMVLLVGRSVLLVDGVRVTPDHAAPLGAGSEVEILPPYAGGSA